MKRFLFVLVLSALAGFACAQSIDEVHLKNGNVIRGTILEMNPSGDVTIQTSEGDTYVYKMSSVDSITRGVAVPGSDFSSLNTFRKIDRRKGYYYWEDNNMQLTEEECASIFNDELYDTYLSAQRQFSVGRGLLIAGLACAGATVVTLYGASNAPSEDVFERNYNMAVLFAEIADVGICLGCVFKGIGKGRLEWVKNTYNTGRYQTSTLKFAPSVMMTAQNELGFGASLKFTF